MPPTNESIITAIEGCLAARRRALLDGDADALARLLHPDFRYVDSLGRELDRPAYLASRRSGELSFERHDPSDVNVVELTPGVVLVTCAVDDAGQFKGEPFAATYRAVHVLVQDRQGWLFLYGQSTAIA